MFENPLKIGFLASAKADFEVIALDRETPRKRLWDCLGGRE